MPTIRKEVTLAANGTNDNVLAGSKFEYLPGPAAIVVYAAADVAGVQLELTMGNTIECDQMAIPVAAAPGQGPNLQDHRIASGVGAGGDRVGIKLTNTTVSAVTNPRILVEIRPL